MSAEDRLRDLLRAEGSAIVPTGDGLVRIRERIARRRRARIWVVPSAALATAAAVGAFFVLTPDDRRTQTLEPAETPPATSQPTVTSSPVPVVPDDGGTPLTQAAIWPFTSQTQAAQWSQDYPYAQDGLQLGRHFVADFLGLKDVDVSQPCVSCDEVDIVVNGELVGEITLARIGVGFASGHGTHVYTVVRVGKTDLTITKPKPGDPITSPTAVTGRAGQPDENVALRLLSQAGDELASTGAPAGREIPWTGTLSWSNQSWSHAGIVGVTRSPKDGAITRVVAVPVVRGAASADGTFAGLVDGHVSLYDGSTGERIRQLTYPPAGKRDTGATWSGGTLAWVRTSGASACANELDQLVGGKASKLRSSTTALYRQPRLSPDGTRLGWVEVPCSNVGGRQTVVVFSHGREVQRLTGPSGSQVDLLDVRDDGTLLVTTNDAQPSGPGTIGIVPAGATTLTGLRPLAPASSCNLASGAAFADSGVVAFESCGERIRLVRFAGTGARVSTDRDTRAEPPTAIAARGESVLVWLFGGDMTGSIARYADGAFTTLVENSSGDCTSTGSQKGCVRAPDW